ncbi:MAG: LysM peptidoglycan-binding domain-containing protein [Deltaproteobacteria bacterium]|nr:LysM peptidoglycan-binding domain-containing protein [Deltaproteobacteria bacterium]
MTNQCPAEKLRTMVVLALTLLLIFSSSFTIAQSRTHNVRQGDTLWDICQAYYGDSNLWPKLWEMNQFVTNPHLLKPGDVLTLFEMEEPAEGKVAESCQKDAVSVEERQGIDLSGFTKPEAVGYLSLVNVEGWGFIEGATSSKLRLAQGDIAFVRFEKNADTVREGQEFSITTVSPMIRHPLTNRPLGHIVATRGILSIKERIKDAHFRAEVSKVFSEVDVGSLVMPATPNSSCVRPTVTDPKLYGNIVALKENQQIIGQFSVVYLDSGFKDGIKRGGVFELIKIITVPSPNLNKDSFQEITAKVTEKLKKEEYLADFWKKLKEGEKIYEASVGKIMVLEARPDSSTAIVLSSSHELARGAFVKGVSWTDIPDYLVSLPSCPLE